MDGLSFGRGMTGACQEDDGAGDKGHIALN
jgi:hypothetical protein